MGSYLSVGVPTSELVDANVFLKDENALLAHRILDLEEEIQKLNTNSVKSKELLESFDKKILQSVKIMIDNSDNGSSIISDNIERKIYTNVFSTLISVLKEVMEDTKIIILV